MKIRFTKHALEKLAGFAGSKIKITGADIIQTITEPNLVDVRSRTPQYIAQKSLDAKHVLRVVYAIEAQRRIKVITFYPGRKSKYEKEQ